MITESETNENDKKSKRESRRFSSWKDLFWLVITIFILFCFIFLYFIPTKEDLGLTDRENNLFQIVIGINLLFMGIFLERIFSIGENKKNATSAYRRIMDIEKILNRQLQYLGQLFESNKINNGDIRVLIEQNYSLTDTVNSSKSDWTDQIGDVIQTTDQIKGLQQQANTLKKIDKEEYEKISTQIDNLLNDLPYIIQSGLNSKYEPSDPKDNLFIHEYYALMGEKNSEIELLIRIDNDPKEFTNYLDQHKPLQIRREAGMHNYRLNMLVSDVLIGMILSPFSDSVSSMNDFVATIYPLLSNYSEGLNPNNYENGDPQRIIELENYSYEIKENLLTIHLPVDLEKYLWIFGLGVI